MMELSSDAISSLNDYGNIRGLAEKITSCYVLGALCIIGFEREDIDYVLTSYLRPGQTLTDQILATLKRGLVSGQASSSVERGALLSAPRVLVAAEIDAINQQFQLASSFHASDGWVLGTMYLVYGFQGDQPSIITGNYHGDDLIPQSVALAVEIGAVQYLCARDRADYTIEIDKRKFHLPRG